MNEEVQDRVHSLVKTGGSSTKFKGGSTMSVSTSSRIRTSKLLPEAELVKMNTKFNREIGIQVSLIPMAALKTESSID